MVLVKGAPNLDAVQTASDENAIDGIIDST
jgi:hypothetical protein